MLISRLVLALYHSRIYTSGTNDQFDYINKQG